MEKNLNLVAFDCGNSSIRTILCRFDGEKVRSELVLQEPNRITEIDGYYYWDMPQIFETMKKGFLWRPRRQSGSTLLESVHGELIFSYWMTTVSL